MSVPIVVDTSCLIGLERIDRLGVLPKLFAPVLAPPAVAHEYGTPPPWLSVQAVSVPAGADALRLLLGDGEAEAIELARERGCRVVLDDRQARAVAGRLGVSVLGTVGVLVRVKRAGLITHVAPLLEALDEAGFRIDEKVKAEGLRLAGEQT